MKTEKMKEILENVINENLDNCCGHSIEEIFEYLADLGFSKKEAFDFIDRNYLDGLNWQDDDEPEEISVGDSDQAILETALTQIGIKYKFHDAVGYNWIEIETPYNNNIEINFNDKGEFLEICV